MSRQRPVKSSQCRRLGVMSEARGQSTKRWQEVIAVSIGVAGSKMRGLVTMRRNPERTTSDRANGSAVRIDEDVHVGQLHRLPAGRDALEIVGFEQRRRLVDVVRMMHDRAMTASLHHTLH